MHLNSSPITRPAVRLTAITGLLLLSTAALAGPAAAERPEVHKHSCAEAGGVFSKASGVKTCTTTTTTTIVGPVVTASSSIGGPNTGLGCTGPTCGGGWSVVFTGASQRRSLIEVTTAKSQHGNGEVAVTRSEEVLMSEVLRLSCTSFFRSVSWDDKVTTISRVHPLEQCAQAPAHGPTGSRDLYIA